MLDAPQQKILRDIAAYSFSGIEVLVTNAHNEVATYGDSLH